MAAVLCDALEKSLHEWLLVILVVAATDCCNE